MSDETIVSDSTPEVETSEVEVADTSDATQEGQSESFFDPKSLPEELMPAYKQMQGAFTKKTQEIAEQRKQFEALQAQSEKWKQYEPLLPVVDEMLKPQTQVQPSPELALLEQDLRKAGYDDTSIEAMKITAQRMLDIFEQKSNYEKQAEIQTRQISEAEALDPRLTNDEKFARMVASVMKSQDGWESNIVEATRAAVKEIDEMISTAKSQGKEELSSLAQQKAKQFPSMKSSPQGATSDSSPKTISEAFQQAKAEHGF